MQLRNQGVPFQDFTKRLFNNPVDLYPRRCLPEIIKHRKCMNNVTKSRNLDNQDSHKVNHLATRASNTPPPENLRVEGWIVADFEPSVKLPLFLSGQKVVKSDR
jgi:hypothetical protein